jgi:predicted acyltransferase
MEPTPPNQRALSIDAFRGLTILVMIFVNQLAGVAGVPAWARHMPADADAMSFVDVVFPAFLFIVGMAIPFSLARRDAVAAHRHVLGRTVGLVVLGFFMVNAESGYDERWMPWSIATWSLAFYACVFMVWGVHDRIGWRTLGVLGLVVVADAYQGGAEGKAWMTHQWWGILGLIGWSYLISASVFLLCRGRIAALLLAAAACIAFYAAGHAIAPERHPGWAALFAEQGMVCETSITLLGVVTSLLFFGPGTASHGDGRPAWAGGFVRPLVLAAVLVVAGALLRPAYTISKIYASPTWCLYSSAICIALYAVLVAIVDVRGRGAWVRWIMPAAANPLVAYLIPFIVEAALQAGHVRLPDALDRGWTGVAFSVAYALLVLGATALVTKRVRLRL